MKIINIYIRPKDKQELCRIRDKYHISFSTIANIVMPYMDKICKDHSLYEKRLEDRRIEKKFDIPVKRWKTSIKPKDQKYNLTDYDCGVNLFISGDYKKWLNDEDKQKITNQIYREFQETYDENWNGNRTTRSIVRFFKKNPEYAKKLIDEEC